MKRCALLLWAVVCLHATSTEAWSQDTPDPGVSVPAPSAPNAVTSNISAVWANEGGDKVSQEELRATNKKENLTGTVLNRAWDGTTIQLSGARNEIVNFDLVLEAAQTAASNVSVSFDSLTGPNGAKIQTGTPATGDGVFNWTNRPIELFYMRYVEIKGLSKFGYYKGNEGDFPTRFQAASHLWTDRPDHNKMYPDILVPLELVNQFQIAAGKNQSVWADIYVPKQTPPGVYTGQVTIAESGSVTRTVPVKLTVSNFSLPDVPSLKQFTNVDPQEIMWRYVTGYAGYVGWNTDQGRQVKTIADRYYQFLHRHKLDAIAGETECPSRALQPCYMNIPRYTGDLYTAANGYDGPGVNQGTSIYSIGTYGSWGRNITDPVTMALYVTQWESWFQQNLPDTERIFYLQDEPTPNDLPQLDNWAKWVKQALQFSNSKLLTLSTVSLYTALPSLPNLDVAMTLAWIGDCGTSGPPCDNTAATNSQISRYLSNPNRQLWLYNMNRPGVGTDDTEDDGIAMRTVAWAQYKMNVKRWFYWYANMNQVGQNWFQTACTWDCGPSWIDGILGETSAANYSNGIGLLLYPGNDVAHPADSYGVNGPIASLRLKEMRRGLQDGDYLTLAAQIDPVAVQSIVAKTMPKALWENQAPQGDPSWFLGPVSWSPNPDDWESSRAQLATIISNYCSSDATASYCQ